MDNQFWHIQRNFSFTPKNFTLEIAGELDAEGSGMDIFISKHGRFVTVPPLASADRPRFSPLIGSDVEDFGRKASKYGLISSLR